MKLSADSLVGAHSHSRRHILSRRQFLGTAATGAVMLTSSIWMPAVANARSSASLHPKPIPGGLTIGGKLFHLKVPTEFGFSADAEPSAIFDFRGTIGRSLIHGTGTRTDAAAGTRVSVPYEADMGFMQGEFVDVEGRTRRGTFTFV